jgi:hypothetical protein
LGTRTHRGGVSVESRTCTRCADICVVSPENKKGGGEDQTYYTGHSIHGREPGVEVKGGRLPPDEELAGAVDVDTLSVANAWCGRARPS